MTVALPPPPAPVTPIDVLAEIDNLKVSKAAKSSLDLLIERIVAIEADIKALKPP